MDNPAHYFLFEEAKFRQAQNLIDGARRGPPHIYIDLGRNAVAKQHLHISQERILVRLPKCSRGGNIWERLKNAAASPAEGEASISHLLMVCMQIWTHLGCILIMTPHTYSSSERVAAAIDNLWCTESRALATRRQTDRARRRRHRFFSN